MGYYWVMDSNTLNEEGMRLITQWQQELIEYVHESLAEIMSYGFTRKQAEYLYIKDAQKGRSESDLRNDIKFHNEFHHITG